MKLVYIEWWDHTSLKDYNWTTEVEMLKLSASTIRTIGFVIKETKDFLWICSTLSIEDAGYYNEGKHVHCIVKSCIKKRKNVKI
jgi:hypothetical protein